MQRDGNLSLVSESRMCSQESVTRITMAEKRKKCFMNLPGKIPRTTKSSLSSRHLSLLSSTTKRNQTFSCGKSFNDK